MPLFPSTLRAFREMLDRSAGVSAGASAEELETFAFNVKTLEERLPTIVSFPADAQLALLRWAWVHGVHSKKFPAMFAALKKLVPDFDAAAEECVWKDESLDARVIMNALFQNATDSLQLNRDPSVLVWPREYKEPPSLVSAKKMSLLQRWGLPAMFGLGAAWVGYRHSQRKSVVPEKASPAEKIEIPKFGARTPESAESRGKSGAKIDLQGSVNDFSRREAKLEVRIPATRVEAQDSEDVLEGEFEDDDFSGEDEENV